MGTRITPDEVRHVAELARVDLDPAEEEAMVGQLDKILAYVAKLRELDTEAVEPTAHVLDVPTSWREDRATSRSDSEALLRNAPDRHGPFFRVPKIIE